MLPYNVVKRSEIYFWHKGKHIPFVNFTWDFGILRIKSFEAFQNIVMNFDKNNIPALF